MSETTEFSLRTVLIGVGAAMQNATGRNQRQLAASTRLCRVNAALGEICACSEPSAAYRRSLDL